MRSLASYLAGILTLLMILAAGGAWSPASEPRFVSVSLPASAAAFTLLDDLPPPAPEPVVRTLPPGCRIPLREAACPVTAVAGGLALPRTAYDLVPPSWASVEDWRPLVSAFFRPEDVDRALRVIWCESKGDPEAANPTSTARGLFQHLGSRWERRSERAGLAGADIFDPVANVAVAAWLVYHYGGWSHWAPSAGCWR